MANRLLESKDHSAAQLISGRIAELADWRGETLGKLRALIKEADPDILEEWKWETPVWSHAGIVCTGETYKATVKMTFAKGASLKDPAKLFNSSLEGNARRAIDIREGEKINARALKALIREAVEFNVSSSKPAAKKPASKASESKRSPSSAKKVATLKTSALKTSAVAKKKKKALVKRAPR